MSEKFLAGKIALVTGGSRGIGASLAVALASRGADVAIAYANATGHANAVVEQIQSQGVRGAAFRADLGKKEDARSLVEQVVTFFGGLDILISSAGNSTGGLVDDPNTNFDQADDFWNVSLMGPIHTARAAAKVLRDHGRIVFITSPLGEHAGFPGGADNAGQKGGLDSYARGLARDLGRRNITVNSIHPGLVKTDISVNYEAFREKIWETFVLPRWGTLRELDHAALFLVHPDAGFTTGSVVKVDGGYSA